MRTTATPVEDGTTLFLVSRPSPGLEVTTLPKLGLRPVGSCAVSMQDVFVPDDDVLLNRVMPGGSCSEP